MPCIYDPEIYDEVWFSKRAKFHSDVETITLKFLKMFGPFRSSLDLGAGDGWYSKVLSDTGSDAWAVELHQEAIRYFPALVAAVTHDLREPLDLGRVFDLVICLEVAEHLPETAETVLCDTIARHCDDLLLFSAAPPGQGGRGHVNCKPKEYWKQLLRERGLIFLPEATAELAAAWKALLQDRLVWLPKNVMLFQTA